MDFSVTKRQGVVINREEAHRWLDHAFGLMPNGVRQISLRKPYTHRSIQQNRMMWAWFNCIAAETGNLPQDIHDYYCGKFLTRTIEINGVPETVSYGTSGLSTAEMKAFLDRVQADAASELGIILPSPDDEIWKVFEDHYSNRI